MPGLTYLLNAIGPIGLALCAVIAVIVLGCVIMSLADAGRDSFR